MIERARARDDARRAREMSDLRAAVWTAADAFERRVRGLLEGPDDQE